MKKFFKDPFVVLVLCIGLFLSLLVGIPLVYEKLTRYDVSQSVEVVDKMSQARLYDNWLSIQFSKITLMEKADSICPYDLNKTIYVLETKMGNRYKIDYGDKATIEKLKCQRLAEFEKKVEDAKKADIAEEIAERKRDSIIDADLEILNKPCK